jgi:hypothetical protein
MPRQRNAHVLKAELIVKTIDQLRARVAERFPNSGLAQVCVDLLQSARATTRRVDRLARPYYGLRFLAGLVLAAGVAAQIYIASLIDWHAVMTHADAVGIAEGLESTVNLILVAGGAIAFVLTFEQRLKRRRVQRQFYEFRSFAHVIDMHQLTKDPTVILGDVPPTASSPQRHMTEFELSRYLDYCAEMLSLISKLAALYAGRLHDREVVAQVNEVEELTSNLGRKIWQKIMILSRLDERQAVAALAHTSAWAPRPDARLADPPLDAPREPL